MTTPEKCSCSFVTRNIAIKRNPLLLKYTFLNSWHKGGSWEHKDGSWESKGTKKDTKNEKYDSNENGGLEAEAVMSGSWKSGDQGYI